MPYAKGTGHPGKEQLFVIRPANVRPLPLTPVSGTTPTPAGASARVDLRGLTGRAWEEELDQLEAIGATADPQRAERRQRLTTQLAGRYAAAFRDVLGDPVPTLARPMMVARPADSAVAIRIQAEVAARLNHPVWLKIGDLEPVRQCPPGG